MAGSDAVVAVVAVVGAAAAVEGKEVDILQDAAAVVVDGGVDVAVAVAVDADVHLPEDEQNEDRRETGRNCRRHGAGCDPRGVP